MPYEIHYRHGRSSRLYLIPLFPFSSICLAICSGRIKVKRKDLLVGLPCGHHDRKDFLADQLGELVIRDGFDHPFGLLRFRQSGIGQRLRSGFENERSRILPDDQISESSEGRSRSLAKQSHTGRNDDASLELGVFLLHARFQSREFLLQLICRKGRDEIPSTAFDFLSVQQHLQNLSVQLHGLFGRAELVSVPKRYRRAFVQHLSDQVENGGLNGI